MNPLHQLAYFITRVINQARDTTFQVGTEEEWAAAHKIAMRYSELKCGLSFEDAGRQAETEFIIDQLQEAPMPCTWGCPCGARLTGATQDAMQALYDKHRETCETKPPERDLRCLGCTMGPPLAHSPRCAATKKTAGA